MTATEESGLVQHAIRELEFGNVEEDVRPSLVEAVRAFASYGHSGGSSSVCVQILNDLLHYRPLGPLTSSPDEWMHIDEAVAGQPNLWQSRRNPEAFSLNGGATYYVLSEERRWIPFRLRRWLRKAGEENLVFPMHKAAPARG